MCIQKHMERNKTTGATDYGNYVSYAQSLPATIVMNGLGQACATLLAKADGDLKDANRMLYDDLQSWLCRDHPAAPFPKTPDLMQAIIEKDQRHYLRAQTEALAYLVWLKKFANAYLERGGPE
jgi:CRISPR-associated protein Cmr5